MQELTIATIPLLRENAETSPPVRHPTAVPIKVKANFADTPHDSTRIKTDGSNVKAPRDLSLPRLTPQWSER